MSESRMKPSEMRDVLMSKIAWIQVRVENNEGNPSLHFAQKKEAHAIRELLKTCGLWNESDYTRQLENARRRRGNRGHIRVEVITQHRRTST